MVYAAYVGEAATDWGFFRLPLSPKRFEAAQDSISVHYGECF